MHQWHTFLTKNNDKRNFNNSRHICEVGKSYCLGTKTFQNKRQEGREGGKEIRDGDERRGGEGKGWEGREDRQ